MFHLSRFASQGNPVFYTFLASPALFHPNLFGAYRHVGQECCDWFSEVGTRAGQPTKLNRAGGASGHTHRASGIMPLPLVLLSFVSPIYLSEDKYLGTNCAHAGGRPTKLWEHLTGSSGNMRPHRQAITRQHHALTPHGARCHTDSPQREYGATQTGQH